jgi:hypothetical protein
LPTFAKPFTEYSPDSPTFAKGHFWEKCDSQVTREFREFSVSGHSLVILELIICLKWIPHPAIHFFCCNVSCHFVLICELLYLL